eukprot:scaffold274764_cov30-Tisochrysis_lutea.AAC.3
MPSSTTRPIRCVRRCRACNETCGQVARRARACQQSAVELLEDEGSLHHVRVHDNPIDVHSARCAHHVQKLSYARRVEVDIIVELCNKPSVRQAASGMAQPGYEREYWATLARLVPLHGPHTHHIAIHSLFPRERERERSERRQAAHSDDEAEEDGRGSHGEPCGAKHLPANRVLGRREDSRREKQRRGFGRHRRFSEVQKGKGEKVRWCGLSQRKRSV